MFFFRPYYSFELRLRAHSLSERDLREDKERAIAKRKAALEHNRNLALKNLKEIIEKMDEQLLKEINAYLVSRKNELSPSGVYFQNFSIQSLDKPTRNSQHVIKMVLSNNDSIKALHLKKITLMKMEDKLRGHFLVSDQVVTSKNKNREETQSTQSDNQYLQESKKRKNIMGDGFKDVERCLIKAKNIYLKNEEQLNTPRDTSHIDGWFVANIKKIGMMLKACWSQHLTNTTEQLAEKILPAFKI